MSEGYSRRTVLRGVAGGASALALPAGPATDPGAGPDPAAVADGVPGAGRAALSDHDRAAFLAAQDPVWARMPRTWYEGPFLGNGFLGSILYAEPAANGLRFTVQHSEVQDHRPQIQGTDWGVARLPVGHLTLEPVGQITGVQLRLHLWDAEVRGTITTDKGHIRLRALVQNDRSLLLVTARPSRGERDFRWVFHSEKALSPRIVREPPPPALVPNPDPVLSTVDGVNLVVQPMVAGGQTATAYRETTAHGERVLYLTVAHTFPETSAQQRVLETVARAIDAGVRCLVDTHRDWWHGYFRKSFLSLPDGMLQSFYWIRLYKVAAAARREAPVMATTGPWLEPTPWPGVWWNLNVQLEYWLIHGSNHLELDTITTTLAANQQQLINNVPSQYRPDSSGVGRSSDMFANRSVPTPGSSGTPEVGDLTWALHNVWLSWRHTMDDTMLRDTLFPILRRAINYYLHFLSTGTDGKLHLPTTFSPEYGPAPDCNYDLALIRWGCQTLLDSAQRLGITDPLASRWRQVLSDITPYPVDTNGFMIGRGVPYAMSHRHYSHLLMIYPLYDVTWEQPQNQALIEKSVRRWHALTGAHRGYSYTGAASMFASMGKADEALSFLLKFFDTSTSFPVRPNTMYTEAGPVVETPLSASQSLLDMLCTSWGGVIRVFPAVPTTWKDATLHNFLTQGAFLVSAARSGGATRFVRLRSLAGEPCRVRPGITPAGSSTVYEAENAGIFQGVVESNHAGFTGTGFVNGDNAVGSYVEYMVTAAAAGPHTLTFRYANGTTVNRPTDVAVNG